MDPARKRHFLQRWDRRQLFVRDRIREHLHDVAVDAILSRESTSMPFISCFNAIQSDVMSEGSDVILRVKVYYSTTNYSTTPLLATLLLYY